MFHSKHSHFVNGITINVRNLADLRPFYETILGFEVITETNHSVQYEIGQSNHFLTLNEVINGREPLLSEAGLFYVGIMLPNITDLADLLVQMTDFEIPVMVENKVFVRPYFLKIQRGMHTSFMSTMVWITGATIMKM